MRLYHIERFSHQRAPPCADATAFRQYPPCDSLTLRGPSLVVLHEAAPCTLNPQPSATPSKVGYQSGPIALLLQDSLMQSQRDDLCMPCSQRQRIGSHICWPRNTNEPITKSDERVPRRRLQLAPNILETFSKEQEGKRGVGVAGQSMPV